MTASILKVSAMAMGAWLVTFSTIWAIGGLGGAILFTYREQYAMAAISGVLFLLVVGLWLRWHWVKTPLIAYWAIMAACGVFLIVFRPWGGVSSLRYLSPLYFVYLVARWRPELWPRSTVVV